MESNNKAMKAGFWFAVCNIIQKIVMIITVPVFTRMMTPEEYGLTAVYQSWDYVLMIVVTLRLSLGVFNNGMLQYKDDRDRYISAMQGLSTVSAFAFLALFSLLRKQFTAMIGLPVSVIFWMLVSYIFLPAFEYWSARNRYEYRYKSLLVATLLYAVANILFPLIAVSYAKRNLGEIKILATLMTMIGFTAAFYVYNFCKGKCFFIKKYWKHAFWFNLPLLPNYLSSVILSQSDRIMISRFCGDELAGIYSVACYLQTGVTVITNAISSAFIPWLYERLENKDFGQIKKWAEPILVLLGYLTFVIVSCAPEIIKIMAAEEYYEAIWVVAPVVIGTYLTVLYMFCANIEIYYEKRVFMSCATMLAAILNVVLNYLLIPIFGYIVCAYTTVFCYLIYGVAHYLFMNKIKTQDGVVGNYHIYDMKHIVAIYGIVIMISAMQVGLYGSVFMRYLFILLVTGIVIFCWRKAYRRIKILNIGNTNLLG